MRRKAGSILEIERAILETGIALRGSGVDEFHGYRLAREMEEREQARRLVAHGTLYKALDRLEAAGLIKSRWEDPHDAARENRPRRRLYEVTASGSAALARVQQEEQARSGALRQSLNQA